MAAFDALNFIIDITNPSKNGILQSFNNNLPASAPLFIRNDVENVTLRFVQPSATTTRPWDDVDVSTALTILALGEFDAVPSSGTFTLRYGPTTTGTLTMSSTSVTITGSTTGIINGMSVIGTGIASGTTATISGSTVTLSNAATANGSESLYFFNETGQINAGASAATVSAALNLLPSMIIAGSCIVTSTESGEYLVVFEVTGPMFLIQGNPVGLNPAATILASEVVAGSFSPGLFDEQVITIFNNPYALNSTWNPFPSAAAIVTTIAAGATVNTTGTTSTTSQTISTLASTTGIIAGMSITGSGIPANTSVISVNSGASTCLVSATPTASNSGVALTFTSPNVQNITLNPIPYDGTFQITTPLLTTGAIPAGASAAAVQAALNIYGANYVVTSTASSSYAITIPGASAAYTVNISGLIVPIGLAGTLTLSTYAMLQKFIASGLTEITLDLEVQVTPSGGGQSTPLQLIVSINKNVINLSQLVPSPTTFYYTAAQSDARYLRIANWLNALASSSSSTSGTTTITREGPVNIEIVTISAGSGSFTRNLSLAATNAQAGDILFLFVTMPASANPTIPIIDAASAATLDTILPNPSNAINYLILLAFNGSNWIELFRSA